MAPYLKLFVVLSLLLLCYTLCVPACAASGVKPKAKSAVLFKKDEKLKIFRRPSGEESLSSNDITPENIELPLLVAAKDGLTVAVVEVSYKQKEKQKVGVVAKYLEAHGNFFWKNSNIESVVKNWQVQLATENDETLKVFSTTRASVVSGDGSQIYIIFLGIPEKHSDQPWSFRLVKGTVSDVKKQEKGKSKKITWETKKLKVTQSNGEAGQTLKDVHLGSAPYDQFAFLNKENKIMCVVKSNSKKDGAEDFTAVFWLNEEKNESELLFAEKTADRGSIFEWEGELYRTLTTVPNDSRKKVMVFDESENDFTESDSPITRLGDFLKDKKNFATSKIGAEGSALLFTEERQNRTAGAGKKDAYLWMSDGDRVGYVGSILSGFKETFYGPVLYTNNNLFALYQKYNDEGKKQNNVFYLIRLDEQFTNATNTLKAWRESNEKVKKLCEGIFTTKIPCTTDGLVGLLHETTNTEGVITEWKDEYFYSNATVKGGQKAHDGITFKGEGAGAIWPVKKAAEEQPYNFTDSGFTLVATVTVGGEEEIAKDAPILGVVLADDGHVGLWCTKGGKWGASNEKDKAAVTTSKENCEREASYRVALVLNNEKVSIYVNEKELKDLNAALMDIGKGKNIKHFYFGAYINAQSTSNNKYVTDVIVANAFLYNRPLATPQESAGVDIHSHTGGYRNEEQVPRGDATEKTNKHSATSNTKRNKEEEMELSTNDSAVRVGVVGVLCFMLFGVFTLLGRYVH